MKFALDTVRSNRRDLIVGSVALAALAGVARSTHTTFAQDAGDTSMWPLPEDATVVGQGLWNPRDIALGTDGTIYIAESGVAGDTGAAASDSVATAVDAVPPLVAPQISLIAPDGTQMVFTTEVGGVGIGFYEDSIYVSAGANSVGRGYPPVLIDNTIDTVAIPSGEVHRLALIGAHENEDDSSIVSNLYGLDITADGIVYIADAGTQTIYELDTATGDLSPFTVIPNLDELGTTGDSQSPLPTSVAIAPDGTITVVFLSETGEGPSILDYQDDGSYTVRETDQLSMIVDATYGPDGLLYVSQLSGDLTGQNPGPGAIFRIETDGTATPVVENIYFPHGLAFHPQSGNLFVVSNSVVSGPDAALGLVVRFDDIATPTV